MVCASRKRNGWTLPETQKQRQFRTEAAMMPRASAEYRKSGSTCAAFKKGDAISA
jgi:hypothetical protein